MNFSLKFRTRVVVLLLVAAAGVSGGYDCNPGYAIEVVPGYEEALIRGLMNDFGMSPDEPLIPVDYKELVTQMGMTFCMGQTVSHDWGDPCDKRVVHQCSFCPIFSPVFSPCDNSDASRCYFAK
ncbi:hypothetical protein BOX15_Mlig015797g1 [Macrostomum lignano]|uniref:FZ domain-containing protein n=1 Tax=Macrostomum lignano TaxID=282301 RepID=A0A267F043_9PLAT|nr:hypothetical protein BOX15_Mlig015797g1 [Macrostomum lignano]